MKLKEFNDPFYILGYPLEPIVKKCDDLENIFLEIR
jgi:hypothetical protein